MPNLNLPPQHQPPENHRQNDLNHLRDDENLALVESVGHRTADHGEGERWDSGGKINHPEENGFIGERAHAPALGHDLHPRARIRNGAAENVTAKWSRSQKLERSAPK